MPDTFGSYDNMRVHEYLDFFGAAFKIPSKERGHRLEEVMETSGVTYMKDRFVESLSHGKCFVCRTLSVLHGARKPQLATRQSKFRRIG